MEPRPPKLTRPVTGVPSPVATPPPVPTAERLASRPAWIETGSAGGSGGAEASFGLGRDERGAIDAANGTVISPPRARAAWQDPGDDPTGEPGVVGGLRSPLSPVVAPRGERRSRFLGPILAAILLVLVVGGAAFAVDKARDGSDNRNAAEATSTAETVAGTLASPPVTSSTGASDEAAETPTGEAAQTVETAGNASAGTVQTEDGEAAPASPTEAASSDEGNATGEEPVATKRATEESTRASGGTVRAADVLPGANDLADGFAMTRDGALKKADVVAALGEGGEASLTEWKWRENAVREFTIEGADPDTTFFLSVSVHRTGDREGAAELLDALADVLADIPGYEEVDAPEIGEQTRAMESSTDEASVYALYVRSGYLVLRLGGSSVSGDPSDEVIALAKQLIGD